MASLVLVTGSAGRLGQAAVTTLLSAGFAVRGFDRRPTPGLPAEQYVVGELTDGAIVLKAMTDAEVVIHLAACPDDAQFPRQDAPNDGDNFLGELVPANIIGLYHVMEAARKLKTPRLVLASTVQTIEGYLEAKQTPVTLSMLPRPRYLYACTKVFLEGVGRVYAEQHKLNVLAVRFGWCPRDARQIAEIAADPEAQDIYLSQGDAGRFFVACVQSHFAGYHVVFCTSLPTRNLMYDLEPTRLLLNWSPTDRWPA